MDESSGDVAKFHVLKNNIQYIRTKHAMSTPHKFVRGACPKEMALQGIVNIRGSMHARGRRQGSGQGRSGPGRGCSLPMARQGESLEDLVPRLDLIKRVAALVMGDLKYRNSGKFGRPRFEDVAGDGRGVLQCLQQSADSLSLYLYGRCYINLAKQVRNRLLSASVGRRPEFHHQKHRLRLLTYNSHSLLWLDTVAKQKASTCAVSYLWNVSAKEGEPPQVPSGRLFWGSMS